jgi:hypothetical protein
MTICVECRWHRDVTPGEYRSASGSDWVYLLCAHPRVALPSKTDPVTGKSGYGDLSNDYPWPNCRGINKKGKCKHFEAPVDAGHKAE